MDYGFGNSIRTHHSDTTVSRGLPEVTPSSRESGRIFTDLLYKGLIQVRVHGSVRVREQVYTVGFEQVFKETSENDKCSEISTICTRTYVRVHMYAYIWPYSGVGCL